MNSTPKMRPDATIQATGTRPLAWPTANRLTPNSSAELMAMARKTGPPRRASDAGSAVSSPSGPYAVSTTPVTTSDNAMSSTAVAGSPARIARVAAMAPSVEVMGATMETLPRRTAP